MMYVYIHTIYICLLQRCKCVTGRLRGASSRSLGQDEDALEEAVKAPTASGTMQLGLSYVLGGP